jgi:Phage tail protein RIFT-related domain
VLTEVKAFSSWRSAPTLPLSETGRAETDLIQIRNIDGLDPVKASVNTSPLGSVDGASFVGSSVLGRNIVLTLHPNPDWDTWTFESIRRLLYSYFMPKRATRLIFYSDDMPPVEISGVVESVEVNVFSKDPEIIVSIICPDPYFTAVDATVLTGQTVRPDGNVVVVDYNGTIETGIKVKVTWVADPVPTDIAIQIGDPILTYFAVFASVDSLNYFETSSIPLQKFVQNVNIGTGIITSLLSKVHVQEGSLWPTLQPGENEFSVVTDQGTQDWELSYFERFGGL